MQTPEPPRISANPDRPGGIADSYTVLSNLPDEMIDLDGSVRPYWRRFVTMLDEIGAQERLRRWNHAQRLIRETGASHNVYADPDGQDRPWGLDLIPVLIPAEQWQRVCQGLIQRARLLDALIADLYGPARTIREGLLPPQLVWANPSFLRPCHDSVPAGNSWLHLYAADLVRSADGRYEVLNDRTQAPSGAGYSLENRIVLSRTLRQPFRQCNVELLAPFFSALRETMTSLAPAHQDNPRIVLLTPGPYNETYFEQSFLAKYLGYALVQGDDLTVRDSKVYLKTVGGLQQVDVILRRVDDDFCDPLELYAASYLGVPGLLQAVRQGHVTVANSLGTGVLQAPGFLPFLPGLCRHLLSEELQLPSVPTWWCGQPQELQFVLERLGQLVIKSAHPTRGEDPLFGQNMTAQQLAELADRIRANPDRYVAQNQVMSWTTPALIQNQLQPRHFTVRPYLTAFRGSYTVMNGALTRITPATESYVVSLQRGGGSKDTWILSDGPVSQMSLLPPTVAPITLTRGVGDLPSRHAEDLFWLGRYLERVGCQARLARATLACIAEPSAGDESQAGRILAAALQGDHAGPYNAAFIHKFIEDEMGDSETGGLRAIVIQAHRLMKLLRERLPPDAWTIIQELHERVMSYQIDPEEPGTNWAAFLGAVISAVAALLGLADDSMTGSRSWRFLGLGRRIERALFTTDLLQHAIVNPGNDPLLLQSVLEIADSSFPYRRRYLAHLEAHAVVDLLLADETNPRSVAFQLARIHRHLVELPRDPTHPNGDHDQQLLAELRDSIKSARLPELCASPDDQSRDALGAFLANVSNQIASISEAVGQLYFTHAAISRALGQMDEELGA